MPRVARWAARTGTALGAFLLLLVGLLLFLDRTPPGQRLVLRFVLGRVAGAIDGTIAVQDIRSPTLLRGVTLHGISVRGAEARPFLDVDSARATYLWRSFLTGDVGLSSLVAWSPHLTLSRYPGEDDFNADRIFRTDVPKPDVDPTRRVIFHDVRLVDAFVDILQPVDPDGPPPERMLTVAVPGVEERLHRIFFEGIQAWMPDVVVASPAHPGPEARLDSLTLVGHVYEDPFRLTQLQGAVSWAEGKLGVAAEELSLPATRTAGRILVDFTPEEVGDPEPAWVLDVQLTSPGYSLEDLQWLIPELPAGTGEGSFEVRLTDLGDLRLRFSDATLALDDSRLAGSGTVLSDGVLAFQDVRLRADPLALPSVEPFIGELPLSGTVRGDVALDGTFARLQARGVVTLREPGYAPTTADFRGVFHLGDRVGVTDLVATLSPLDYGLLAAFVPESRFEGAGRAELRATGSLDGGLRFRADLLHEPGGGLPTSHVLAEGDVRGSRDDMTLDVRADVAPLSLTAVRSYYPELPVSGEVSGSVLARGALSDLALTTDLETVAGHLALEARFDARNPGGYYRVEGELGEFVVSRLVADLPEPTIFTGYVLVEGRGTDLRTATIDAVVAARASRVGELDVDTARVAMRVRDGLFHLDDANALVSGVDLQARGTLAAHEEGAAGEIHVVFAAESLERLRPLLMDADVVVRGDMSPLELEVLRAEGIDPDTLPTIEEAAVSGSARGEVTLRGSLQRFSAEGSAALEQARYGPHFLGDARVTFAAAGLPDPGASLQGRVLADSVELFGRTFAAADVEIAYVRPEGRVQLLLERDPTEDYRARARFELDGPAGRLDLEALSLRFDVGSWQLERPAVVVWDEVAVRVAELELVSAVDDARIAAAGVLPREGDADFGLDVRGLRLEQVGQLLQREDGGLAGLVDLELRLRGTAGAPLVEGRLDARGVRYQEYALEHVGGTLDYGDRRIGLDLEARDGDLRVLHATGTIPAVLDLSEPTLRFPDEPIGLVVVADSLPAAFVATLFPDLLDVEGTVAAEFDIAGTLDNPEPRGTLVLQNAAWTLEAIGVRHRNVEGTVTLRPDGTMEVDAVARADGTARLSGTVRLEPLSNPTFNLELSFANFRAVDRRDVFGNITGIIRLTGAFDRPVVEGLRASGQGLRVDRGVLYLEEFARAATVVDLADPRFAEFVDPGLLETRVIEESQNPFMQNLRVSVDLDVEQDTWLRSSEMNVEIGGRLAVTYDRARLDIVLVGELTAIRGSYTILGRRFEVQEGRVEFLGLPGIDPDLDIVARTRVRRQNTEPLDVIARVTGSLTQPRVELVSDEAAMNQSDLISYLLFGRPSYELASGQRAALDNASGAFRAGLDVVGSVFSGAVATHLGSVLARQWGLDYLAITETGDQGWHSGSFSQTQVELGQYLTHDLFLVLAFQPVQVVGERGGLSTFGVRLEYSPTDAYTLEAFWEDRYLRTRAIGFQDVALRPEKIQGLFLFTEWGY